jgi:predicted Zn finger-like uncharacterized protein
MPQLVKCPHCQKQLNVPDNLLGKNVKCPSCQNAFVATAESAAEPPSVSRRVPPTEEAVSGLAGDSAGLRPHRGMLVLILGIASAIIVCCPLVNWIAGGLAIYFGGADLKAMDRGEMDPSGRGMTKIGWILGIVGVIIGTLACCGGSISGIVSSMGGGGR